MVINIEQLKAQVTQEYNNAVSAVNAAKVQLERANDMLSRSNGALSLLTYMENTGDVEEIDKGE